MTDKELKRLNRKELVEIIYQLQIEQQQAQQKIASLEQELADRSIRLENAGSIADAALGINHIFESAQTAADEYYQSVQAASAEMEDRIAETDKICEEKLWNADKKAVQILEDAEDEARNIVNRAEKESREKWNEFRKRVDDLLAAQEELRDFLGKG